MPATAILEPFAVPRRVRDKATAATMMAAMPKIAPLATNPKVAGIETSPSTSAMIDKRFDGSL